ALLRPFGLVYAISQFDSYFWRLASAQGDAKTPPDKNRSSASSLEVGAGPLGLLYKQPRCVGKTGPNPISDATDDRHEGVTNTYLPYLLQAEPSIEVAKRCPNASLPPMRPSPRT
ncbi:hypothetical protein ACKVWM_011410, partial [Pyricularia oryzae]